DAKLELYIADEKLKTFVMSNKDLLEMVFLVSQFEIVDEKVGVFTVAEEIEGLSLRVSHATGEKCERCWKYSENLGTNSEYTDICPRCTNVITK
ncbi:MAG: zinc finger domain-containing protein, partial [Psychrilyobacter sp.]|uniref:zinc finger domain-containing protein n=1 Tax=Psychrilyobacter sp. TaxID=2586924 RepID=UPI003C79005B